MQVKRFRVKRAYKTPYTDPPTVSAGECLRIEPRESEWPGWIWCVRRSGQAFWAPQSWVAVAGSEGVMTRDYSAKELSVEAGEELTGGSVESGWVWATNSRQQAGWVPLDYLEEV